jgi:hypothetical protein
MVTYYPEAEVTIALLANTGIFVSRLGSLAAQPRVTGSAVPWRQ